MPNRRLNPPTNGTFAVRFRCFIKRFLRKLHSPGNKCLSSTCAFRESSKTLSAWVAESQSKTNRPMLFEAPSIANQSVSQDLRVCSEYLHMSSGSRDLESQDKLIRLATVRISDGALFAFDLVSQLSAEHKRKVKTKAQMDYPNLMQRS